MIAGQSSKPSCKPAAAPTSGRLAALLLLPAAALTLSGCGAASSVVPAGTRATFQGSVHGGQQRITLSNINLYSANVTNGFVTQLILPVTSDLNGNFSITTDYVCPSPTTPMFITARGGNPGLAAGTNNAAISLAAAIGDCGTLSSSTYIVIDEVTTAAFAAEYNAIQTASTAPLLEAAFTRALTFADFTEGTSPGIGQASIDSGGTVPVAEINTLADIIATCVSSGGTNNSGTACGMLFALTGSPTNTLDALTNLEASPATYSLGGPSATQGNTLALYNLNSTSPPFQPTLAGAPPTWAITAEQATSSVQPNALPHASPKATPTNNQMTATPDAGSVGDTVVITSDAPPACPIAPPLSIEFGTAFAGGSFNSSEITATVPDGAGNGGMVSTQYGVCTFAFYVQGTPAYAIAPQTLAFTSQASGTQSGSMAFTFTNNKGPATVGVGGPASSVLVGGFTLSSTPAINFKTTADTCTGATVTFGNTCTVSVAFTPTAAGAVTGDITFYIGGVNVTATVALSGTGS